MNTDTSIYFDYASTTPVDTQVILAMEPYFFDQFGNASSPHKYGRDAKKALEDARATLANFLGAKPDNMVFTSGATESNNHAIFGLVHQLKDQDKHIIVSKVEHHSVMEPIEYLRSQGVKITYLDVDETGMVDPQDVKQAIQENTALIAVMHASNEIGTIQPVAEIGAIAKEHNIPFLVDAVQTVGHISVNVNELNCDFLSLSAHKFYGPKGVGALYIREGRKIAPYLLGGDQEKSRRASTQNVAGAVGLAKAIELCAQKMEDEAKIQTELRNYLITEVPKRVEGAKVNGHLEQRLPNNAHFSFPGVDGEALLMSLDMNRVAASQGSACTSGALEPSRILRAIGLSDELALSSLRVTLGRWTKRTHIDYLLDKLPELIEQLKI